MAQPDLLIEAGFSDAKIRAEVQKVVESYRKAGKEAQKAFQDSQGKVSDQQALKAHMRELDRLKRAYDPVYTATQKYEASVKKLDQALKIGAIDQAKYTSEIKRAQVELGRVSGLIADTDQAIRRGGGADGIRNLGFQVQDFAVQVGAGTSATQAFAQQFPQLASGFGPLGIAIGTASAVLVPLAAALLKAASDSETLEDRMKALEKSTDAMASAADLAATPISDLRSKYGDLADEIQRANQATSMFAAAIAEGDLVSASKKAAGDLFGGAFSVDQASQFSATDQAGLYMIKLADTLKLGTEEAKRFAAAMKVLQDPKDAKDVTEATSTLLGILKASPEAASRFTAEIKTLGEINAVAAKQIEGQRLEVTRLYEEYDKTTSAMKGLAEDLAKAEAERAKAVSANKTAEVEQWDRVIAKIREMVYETKAAAQETDTLFERMTKSAQGFIEKATSGAKGYMSTDGFAGRYIAERTRGSGSQNEELVRATAAAAEQLGIATKDLLSIIMLESGGRPDIRGGAGDRHIGLIQFGPAEQKKYGAAIGQTITQQMAAVVAYLKDRGVKPGMALPNVYAAVNAGQAHLTNRGDTRNGGIVDNIYNFTTGPKMQPYLNRAEGLLAAYPDIIHETNEAIKEQNRLETESAANLEREVKERERKAEAMQKAREAMAADLVSQQKAADLEAQRAAQIAAINTGPGSDAEKAAAIAAVNAAMEKQITIMALTEEAKRRQVDLDTQMIGSTMTYRQAIEALGDAASQKVIADQAMQSSAQSLAEAQQFASQQMQSLQDGFVDAIIAGESFSDVLKNVAANMAKAWAQAALFGNGPFGGQGGGGLFSGLFGGGFLSKVFGGFRADGGPVSGGRAYVVGERGPEIIVPRSAGQVIPNHAIGKGGGSTSLTIDLRGTTGDDVLDQKMKAAGARILEQARRQAPGWVADNNKRMA